MLLSSAGRWLRKPRSHEILTYMFVSKDILNNNIFYFLFWKSTIILLICKIELIDVTYRWTSMGTNKHKKSHETYRLLIADFILGLCLLIPINLAVMGLLTVIIDVNLQC